jgi:hypothetical protein
MDIYLPVLLAICVIALYALLVGDQRQLGRLSWLRCTMWGLYLLQKHEAHPVGKVVARIGNLIVPRSGNPCGEHLPRTRPATGSRNVGLSGSKSAYD